MTNRLASESSPYLRQHAENPVDWWPWGDEALAEARRTDRPILLSVGYSACHWCHVMEHESFSDEGTAELMNAWFVNVKVDREERPDVDSTYMRAVQALTGRGGWPMTVFLTPDGRPFFGGTYFPPEPRHGMASFRQVLEGVQRAWTERRPAIEKAGSELGEVLVRAATGTATDAVDGEGDVPDDTAVASALAASVTQLMLRFDPTRGGLGPAPKFPQPVVWDLLLHRGLVAGEPHLIEAAVHTLREMGRGGMRDHLGGAFHRYSTDAVWLVPHFEKMLYDNGLLVRLLADAWRVTGDDELRTVADEVMDDLDRTFGLPGGCFAAAWDADSEGEEGRFYVWTPEEVEAVVGPETASRVSRRWDVRPGGNWEGASILHVDADIAGIAAADGVSPEEVAADLAAARTMLRAHREGRVPPLRDDKVVTSWNAMTIRGLAEAGATFGDRPRVARAAACCDALLDAHRSEAGLLRVSMDGHGTIPGFLEDWAALGNAMVSLHEATLRPHWLERALDTAEEMVARFDDGAGRLWDAESKGGLPVRPRDLTDSATPSGNALAVELLLRLGTLLHRRDFTDRAVRILARERSEALRFPAGFGRLLLQQTRLLATPVEVVIAGDPDDPRTVELLATAWRHRPPFAVIAGLHDASPFADTPLLRGRGPLDGRPAAWVCRAFACDAPVVDPADLEASLRAVRD